MTDPVEVLAQALREVRYSPLNIGPSEDLARAILAQITPTLVAESVAQEREACARVSEGMNSHGRFIAAAIRARTP